VRERVKSKASFRSIDQCFSRFLFCNDAVIWPCFRSAGVPRAGFEHPHRA
jgi:hypothetical protein